MLRPLGDWIVVELEPPKTQLQNIHLVREDRVRMGRVLAVGPGGWAGKKKAARRQMDVCPGERVAFFREHLLTQNGKQVTRSVQELGANTALLHINDVLCVVPDGVSVEFY